MASRSLFEIFFGKRERDSRNFSSLKMLNGFMPIFTTFSGEAYDSDVVRSTVDAIARNGAKLKPKHIRRLSDKIQTRDSGLQWLLQVQPNPYMDAYSFYYKVITTLYMQNNSFVYIHREEFGGKVLGLYPINSSSVELLEIEKVVHAKFRFMGGQTLILPYTELIHLRRFFYKNELFGETSDTALNPVLKLIIATNDGIINAIKSSAFVRGILKFTQNLNPTDLKKQKDDFVRDYMSVGNNGGIAATDIKADFQPLTNDPKIIDSKQMSAIEQKVYKYFGISEKIVISDYSEDQWNAFYESVIEPIALQMSLVFTNKLFSDGSMNHGNEILFEANRLQYASNSTKIEVVTMLMDRGMMSQNQGLEVFNMPPIEGGEKRILSLNFIDADKASEYQLGKKQTKPKKENKESESDVGDGEKSA